MIIYLGGLETDGQRSGYGMAQRLSGTHTLLFSFFKVQGRGHIPYLEQLETQHNPTQLRAHDADLPGNRRLLHER